MKSLLRQKSVRKLPLLAAMFQPSLHGVEIMLYRMIFLIIILIRAVEADTYYNVIIKDRPAGYIIESPEKKTNFKGEELLYKRSDTFLQDALNPVTPQTKIVEETYRSCQNGDVIYYNLTCWIKFDKAETICTFKDRKFHLMTRRNGKTMIDKTYPLRPDALVITDYFSLVPIMARVGDKPTSFFVYNPKDTSSAGEIFDTSPLAVFPKGRETLRIGKDDFECRHFSISFKENKLLLWADEAKGEIIRLMQEGGDPFKIELSEQNLSKKLLEPQKLDVIRPLPWNIDNTYTYDFLYKLKNVGSLDFIIKEIKEGYKLLAKGSVTINNRQSSFSSETQFNKNLQPLFYEVKDSVCEGGKTSESHIKCTFIKGGVKQFFTKDGKTIERAVTLPESFILLDNNSIQLFAIFLSQLPLKIGDKFLVSIFHPRRDEVKEVTFQNLNWLEKESATETLMETKSYRLSFWISKQGMLLRYFQGDLLVILRGEGHGK